MKFRNQLLPFLIFSFFIFHFSLLAQNWEAVPLVSQKILNNGFTGGEGCQVVQAIEIDHADGSFLLMGTDVGGIYRSTDGGKNWSPCNIGYSPRGNAGFAIDPKNNQRALAVGGNSIENQSHGLYLTTNQGASWKQVLPVGNYKGYRDFKDKVEFVRGSFDASLGFSKTAYWSWPSGGLYKSENGGETWKKVNSEYGNCNLKVHPDSGFVYAANSRGFFKSTDGGVTFTQKSTLSIRDLDVVLTAPNSVFITTANAIYKSVDRGETFAKISPQAFPTGVVTMNISPADTNYMAVCNKVNDWGGPIYYSQDGGKTWKISARSNENTFVPYNDRLQKFTWHPTNKNNVWALGGDWISGSSDGGKSFSWDANGYNGILVGGFFNFNVFNPELLFVASQDYNGAFTKNLGKSWIYCNASNLGWGGFTYGAYAASENVLVTQNSPGWGENGKLTISRNGGISFTNTSLICEGLDVGCGDPKDPDIIYFSNYYSKDLGKTWNKMNGCKGVFIANLFDKKEVYGAMNNEVVTSADKGETWTKVVSLLATVADIGYDHSNKRLYIVTSGNRLFQFENGKLTEITSRIPVDQYNNRIIQSVAVDPNNPRTVYVAGATNIYKSDASVKRSLDGGMKWEIITPNTRTNNGKDLGDGVNEVFAIRVNPATSDLWAAGGCYGIWKEIPANKTIFRITSPVNNAEFAFGVPVEITAEASDSDGNITKVEFFDGAVKLGEATTPPFSFIMQNPLAGSHTFTACATDNTSQTVTSAPVVVKVKPEGVEITYFEDFNDGLAQDWLPLAGTWAVESDRYRHTTANGIENAVYNGTTFADFTYSANLSSDWDNNFGLIFNYTDGDNYFFVEVDANPQTAVLKAVINGNESTLATANYTGGGAGNYVNVEIKNDGKTTTVKINQTTVFNAVSTTGITFGKIGFYTWWQPVWFDDVDVHAKGIDFSTPVIDFENEQAALTIFPNPVTGESFTIQSVLNSEKKSQFKVFDITGILMYSDFIENKNLTLYSSQFSNPGIYIVQLISNNHIYTGKIIIQKLI